MKDSSRRTLLTGIVLLAAFAVWTTMIQYIDVREAGPYGTKIGFARFNIWFHQMTGIHRTIYMVTDWLGLIPIVICMCFGGVGLAQLIKRKSLLRVDPDILFLGIYYVVVILGYMLFEMIPINYRPILIGGNLETSYPSSTTLLVLSVMPTLKYQTDRRIGNSMFKNMITIFVNVFSIFMVIGRLISGVHWATDIVGSVFLSSGLFTIYRFKADYCGSKEKHLKTEASNGVQ